VQALRVRTCDVERPLVVIRSTASRLSSSGKSRAARPSSAPQTCAKANLRHFPDHRHASSRMQSTGDARRSGRLRWITRSHPT